MRVLYFSRDYTPHDYRFLQVLADSEHEVFFLRLEKRGHTQEDRMLPLGIKQVNWSGGRQPYHQKDNMRLQIDLRRVLREIKPDLIHAGPVQTAAWLVARSGFQPLVTMSWGSDLLVEADSNPRMRRMTIQSLKRTKVLVGDCDAVRQKAISLDFPPERIVIFPWGVDLNHFTPQGENAELRQRAGWQDDFVILHTRSWEPVYGVDVFTRAFAIAARQRQDLRLFLLGNGSLAGEIRRILMSAGVLHQVQFIGQVNQEKLPSYYRAADLYVSASHSDGSSVSLMEALASGLPVLVSNIPSNREWVAQDGPGWLFPDSDVQALAAGILHAVELREKLPEYGQRARQVAEKRADWSRNQQKLFEAYRLAMQGVRS